jgi:GNAT superfamily N-acetyltransferase
VSHRLGFLGTTAAAVYRRQMQYLTVKRLDLPPRVQPSPPPDHETTCVIVESVDALRGIASEMPATFRDSVDGLMRRVALGCVVCVARRKRSDGEGTEIVGYELAQRGVFSAFGRRTAVAADVVFSHWVEVLPTYRGRRIHGLLFAARDAYFRGRGGTIVIGVCAPRNRASLRALRRDGAVIVGRLKQIAVLGRIVWQTPWPRIEAALELGRRLGTPDDPATLDELTPKHA